MASIRGRDTKPELVVRQKLHALGYRYRLHVTALPGSPDLVFPSRRCVLQVHGCFWHAHDCTHGRRRPHSNIAFWQAKARQNRARDARKQAELERLGWSVLVVWECEVKKGAWLPAARRFLRTALRQSLKKARSGASPKPSGRKRTLSASKSRERGPERSRQ
jgi:DNA mismatch endonuclease (patch repair protein)